MKRELCGLLLIIAVSLPLADCVGVSPASPPTVAPAGTTTSKPAAKEDLDQPVAEDRFNKIVIAAKKEGMITAASALASGPRQALAEAFKERYAINIDWISGKGSETVVKIEAERRAGIHTADVILAGKDTQMMFKERGFLEPMDKALILPEVKDARQWMGGKLPFIDPEQMMVSYFIHAASTVVINTNLVKVEEIGSYRDLLSPKWKGKIVMQDPSVSGAGVGFFTINIMEVMGEDFAYQLARQEPLVMRDQRLALEWVARGKYPIVLAPDTSLLGELSRAGAPLKHLIPREGTFTSGGSGGLALLNKAPHPNAAILFVNWLLSKEGQTVVAKAQPDQSKRLDVPTDFIDVDRRMDPNVKYIDGDSEEFMIIRPKMMKLGKEIFGAYIQ